VLLLLLPLQFLLLPLQFLLLLSSLRLLPHRLPKMLLRWLQVSSLPAHH
jgi:hypothetical protein